VLISRLDIFENMGLMQPDVEGLEDKVLASTFRLLASAFLITIGSSPFASRTSNSLFVRNIEAVTRRLVQTPVRNVFGQIFEKLLMHRIVQPLE
jgi:hypothetical protein